MYTHYMPDTGAVLKFTYRRISDLAFKLTGVIHLKGMNVISAMWTLILQCTRGCLFCYAFTEISILVTNVSIDTYNWSQLHLCLVNVAWLEKLVWNCQGYISSWRLLYIVNGYYILLSPTNNFIFFSQCSYLFIPLCFCNRLNWTLYLAWDISNILTAQIWFFRYTYSVGNYLDDLPIL